MYQISFQATPHQRLPISLRKAPSAQQIVVLRAETLLTTRTNRMAFQHNLLVRHPLRMTNLEARIFVLALRCIKQSDTELPYFSIPLEEILPAGTSGQGYEMVHDACQSLLAKHLRLPAPDSEEGSFLYTQIVSDLGLEAGTGLVVGTFAPKISPFLLQLKNNGNFTSASIETLLTFKNPTSQKLYWLLRSWASLGRKEIGVDELRRTLFESEDVYPVYNDFKRYVLQACLKELKQNGGWNIGLEEKKTSRKVTSVVFTIPRTTVEAKTRDKTPKKPVAASAAIDLSNLSPAHQKVVTRLQKLQLKHNQIQDVLSFIGDDENMFKRVMLATAATLRDFEAKNFGHVPQDKLAAATVNILKAELGIWKQ